MSVKSKDKKNRWRNKTVGFRVSPEEWEEIERLVRLSGMSKQEYIMSRLENREIVVNPNPRVIKALRNEIIDLKDKIETAGNINDLSETSKIIANVIIQVSK